MNNYDLDEQAQVLAETHTPHQLAKKYLLAQDLIAFLERMIPNLDELIEKYEEKNQQVIRRILFNVYYH